MPPTASAAVPDDRTLAAAATHRSPTAAAVVLTATERRIPTRMLTAYRAAAVRTAAEHPACHLPWQLLAGIGRIESGHAAGHTLTADGTLTRPILGPPLDGHDGRALLRDTDHGTLDHDTRYDRAVGPMQFIPTTWASAGRDNSGDGRADPDNVDDATLAAAGYLCRHGRDLADPAQLRAAIFSYNPSTSYVRAVLAWTAGYTTGYAATDATPRTAATPGAPVPPLPAYPPPPTSPPLSPSPAPTPTPTPTPTPAPLRSAPTGSASAPRPAADPVAGRPATGPPPPAATAATSTAPGESLGDPSDPPTVPPGGSLRVIPLTTPATPPAAAQSAPPP
ncbi:lytic transglycosylase domain-containing protein [Frankia sp. ArI3]|nr:lytic transglycosylase domain-containing protein [Frankia sp. ArI3]